MEDKKNSLRFDNDLMVFRAYPFKGPGFSQGHVRYLRNMHRNYDTELGDGLDQAIEEAVLSAFPDSEGRISQLLEKSADFARCMEITQGIGFNVALTTSTKNTKDGHYIGLNVTLMNSRLNKNLLPWQAGMKAAIDVNNLKDLMGTVKHVQSYMQGRS